MLTTTPGCCCLLEPCEPLCVSDVVRKLLCVPLVRWVSLDPPVDACFVPQHALQILHMRMLALGKRQMPGVRAHAQPCCLQMTPAQYGLHSAVAAISACIHGTMESMGQEHVAAHVMFPIRDTALVNLKRLLRMQGSLASHIKSSTARI